MCLSRPYQTPLNLARGVYNLTAIHNLEAIELLLVNHNFPHLYCCNARHEYQTGEDVLRCDCYWYSVSHTTAFCHT